MMNTLFKMLPVGAMASAVLLFTGDCLQAMPLLESQDDLGQVIPILENKTTDK